MSDAFFKKQIHLATRLRHSPQEMYMVNLSNRLQEIKKELDKDVTQDYRRKLINEQQEIFSTLDISGRDLGIGLINPNPPPQLNSHGTLANLQNPYII